MTDIISAEQRSLVMSRIRNKNTKPELQIRRLVHALGYRFRLHGCNLPGRPDLVFPGLRKIIFVHGCFWHRHEKCSYAKLPKSNRKFWTPKLNANRKRDNRNMRLLEDMGWSCFVVWECELDDPSLSIRIVTFLGNYRTHQNRSLNTRKGQQPAVQVCANTRRETIS